MKDRSGRTKALSLIALVVLIVGVFVISALLNPKDERYLEEVMNLFEEQSILTGSGFESISPEDSLGEIRGVSFWLEEDNSKVVLYEFLTPKDAKKVFDANSELSINGKFLMKGSSPDAALIFLREFSGSNAYKSKY